MWMPKSNQQANYIKLAANKLSRRNFIMSASLMGGALVIGCSVKETQDTALAADKVELDVLPRQNNCRSDVRSCRLEKRNQI